MKIQRMKRVKLKTPQSKVTNLLSILITRVTATTLTTVVAAPTTEAPPVVIEVTIEATEVEAITEVMVTEVAPGVTNHDSLVILTTSKQCKTVRTNLPTVAAALTTEALIGSREEAEVIEALLAVNLKTKVKTSVRKKLALRLHSIVIKSNLFSRNEECQFSLCV